LDPVVGRQPQIERVTQILGRHTKNNACLIVEPGIGKTAIAEGLAQLIANGDVPDTLEGKKVAVFFLSISSLQIVVGLIQGIFSFFSAPQTCSKLLI
jgi:ATP-dependent Clp protease ATP-binding subunit ClpA